MNQIVRKYLQQEPVKQVVLRVEDIINTSREEIKKNKILYDILKSNPFIEKEETMSKIENIQNQLAKLTCNFNPVEIYTIDNPNIVKERFLNNPKENPVFTYNTSIGNFEEALSHQGYGLESIESKLLELLGETKSIAPQDNKLISIAKFTLIEKIKDDLSTIKLVKGLKSKNESLIKESIFTKYGELDQNTINSAKRLYDEYYLESKKNVDSPELKRLKKKDLLNNPDKLKSLSQADRAFYFDSSEIKEAFTYVLNKYYEFYENKTGSKIQESLKYKFIIDDSITSIDVRDKSTHNAAICIPKNRVVDAYTLLKLLAHEIESHCRQSINGSILFKVGGGALKVDEEICYEGLAKDQEDQMISSLFNGNNNPPLPYSTLAIDLANQGKTFVEVFESIKALRNKAAGKEEDSEFSNHGAYISAYRAFRGHIDTSNPVPFGMTKDMAYLKGWLIQKQLRKKNLSYLNEMAISQVKALPLLARLGFTKDDLPLPILNFTEDYYHNVLKKRFSS